MIGTIIGDIIGSRFEWNNIKTKSFTLFTPDSSFTDDTVMTVAVADALTKADGDIERLPQFAVTAMQQLGRRFPHCGYGETFYCWLHSADPVPYNSFGNGAAMRVSACGFVANSLREAQSLSYAVTSVTHNHPEGVKGAEAVATAIYLARSGSSIIEIQRHINDNYYPMNFTLDEIRGTYNFDTSCQGSVPQALQAFFESSDFEDAIRNAISIGGDSDTIAAITGGIAEAYYGIPRDIKATALSYLDDSLLQIVTRFYERFLEGAIHPREC